MSLPTLTTDRKYGIELEFFGVNLDSLVEALNRDGIVAAYEGYTHATREHWKIVTDSSVSDGYEIVSPILSGRNGLEQIKKVTEILKNQGARLDRRCGFHVHVNARDLTVADVRNCIMRYMQYEPTIDSFMPPSRRGTSNRYCKSMVEIVSRLPHDNFGSINALANHLGGDMRYSKFNPVAYLRHGTVEFRQHSGTIDIKKIANWIAFCLAFVEDSRVTQPQANNLNSIALGLNLPGRDNFVTLSFPHTMRANTKNRLQKLYLKLRDGSQVNPISALDIANHLNVTEASVPGLIGLLRVALPPNLAVRCLRNRGYWLGEVASNPMSPSPTPFHERGLMASLDYSIQSFFNRRQMELAE